MTTPAIGIDFGTTTSCVAVYQHDEVVTFRNELNNVTTPSVVAFSRRGELIGQPALKQMVFNKENTVYDIKRMLGKTYDELMKEKSDWPFKIVNDGGKPKIIVQYRGSMKSFSPEELCSKILQSMRELANDYLEMRVTEAVITIPAYFNDAQRQAMMEAGQLAGLKILKIIPEPTAAALAYGLDKSQYGGKYILVCHLGGGTFDVSLLKYENNNFDVIENDGDPQFGGREFDKRIVEHFIEEFEYTFDTDISDSSVAVHTLRLACEKAKRDLSQSEKTTIRINGLYEGNNFHSTLDRKRFEGLCLTDFRKIEASLDNVLKRANLKKKDIGEVLIAGGSTHIPKVRNILSEYFDRKIMSPIDGNEAIAHGAALEAAILNRQAREIKHTEIVALSKGINISHGRMSTIIKRATIQPCVETASYVTYEDEQTSLTFKIYEGERPLYKDNDYLGKLTISGLTPARRRQMGADVTFKIDDNGMLHVSAKESETEREVTVTLDRSKFKTGAAAASMVAKAEEYKEIDDVELARVNSKHDLDVCALDMLSRIRYDNLEARASAFGIERIREECNDIITWLSTNKDESKTLYDRKKRELESLWEIVFKTPRNST